MSEKTKKQLILEIFEQESMTHLGEAEVRRIQSRLAEVVGKERAASRGYIARVVAEAGKPVQITDSFSRPVMEEPYRHLFEDILKFSTLEQAEHSLGQISARYRDFKAAGDEKGKAYARSVALVGQRRAQAQARRAKTEEMREVKHEIAEWFALWLSAPDLFEAWLELRKQSPEFVKKWGGSHLGCVQEPENVR